MKADVIGWLQPRNYRTASKTLAVLAIVAAAVTIIFAAFQPGNPTTATVLATIGLGVLVAAAGLRVLRVHQIHPGYWAAAPFIAIGLIVTFDFLTSDGSVSAQIFFSFPTLYAASQLRRAGALLVCATAIVGLAVTVLWLLPVQEAVTDVGYVAAAMATAAGLLIAAGERQDALITQLQNAAAVDSLTGLVTRRVLDQAAQAALTGSESNAGIGLMLIDIDKFKTINDQYGHPAGDDALIQVAALLVAACRPTDVASRMGGDEIALLLVGCTERALARRAAAILEQIGTHPFSLNGQAPVSITVSIGIAHSTDPPNSFKDLYSAADAALYRAKSLGRNQVAATATSTS